MKPGSGSWIDAVIKFDVASLACPTLSIAKMLQNGYTSVFDHSGSFVAKSGRRITIEREGRTVLAQGLLATRKTILEDPETTRRAACCADTGEA